MFPPRNADPVEFPLLLIFEARAGLRLFEALDPIRDVINFLLANDPPRMCVVSLVAYQKPPFGRRAEAPCIFFPEVII